MITHVAAYCFAAIDEPHVLADALRERAGRDGLSGTVLVAHEGINFFLAGDGKAIDAFIDHLHADARFAAMPVKRSTSAVKPFARLKVKVKHEIISFRQDNAAPLQGRARAASPAQLAQWIADGVDDEGRRIVLLDTRNAEEVRHGTFDGAVTLPIARFGDFPAAVATLRETLDDATVVSFCTGGIRCEKAALWMQANGFENVWQLDGGILGYFEQVGDFGYTGRCFVFDERVALDSRLAPLRNASECNEAVLTHVELK